MEAGRAQCPVAASFASETFRDPGNFVDILRQSIPLGLATIGQLFVMLAGGIDMSVGMIARVVGLGAAVVMTKAGLPPILVLPVGLLAGAALGFINGLVYMSRREIMTLTPAVAAGFAESLVAIGFGFGCLTVTWLCVAIGMWRKP